MTGQNWGLSGIKNIWPVIRTGDLLSDILSPAFLSSGPATKLYFHVNFSKKNSIVLTPNIGYGEGESGFSFGNSVHFRPDIGGQPKNIGIFVMCLNRFCLRTVTL